MPRRAVVPREDPEIVTRRDAPGHSSGQHRRGEEKSGDPTPQSRPPDVANVVDVADVSPVAVAASANAADGDASPPARPRKFPVAEPKWPRRGRGGHHPGTGPQRGRWVRRLRAYGRARRSVRGRRRGRGPRTRGEGGRETFPPPPRTKRRMVQRDVPAGKGERDTATADKAAGRFTEDVVSTDGAASGVVGGSWSGGGRWSEAGAAVDQRSRMR